MATTCPVILEALLRALHPHFDLSSPDSPPFFSFLGVSWDKTIICTVLVPFIERCPYSEHPRTSFVSYSIISSALTRWLVIYDVNEGNVPSSTELVISTWNDIRRSELYGVWYRSFKDGIIVGGKVHCKALLTRENKW